MSRGSKGYGGRHHRGCQEGLERIDGIALIQAVSTLTSKILSQPSPILLYSRLALLGIYPSCLKRPGTNVPDSQSFRYTSTFVATYGWTVGTGCGWLRDLPRPRRQHHWTYHQLVDQHSPHLREKQSQQNVGSTTLKEKKERTSVPLPCLIDLAYHLRSRDSWDLCLCRRGPMESRWPRGRSRRLVNLWICDNLLRDKRLGLLQLSRLIQKDIVISPGVRGVLDVLEWVALRSCSHPLGMLYVQRPPPLRVFW